MNKIVLTIVCLLIVISSATSAMALRVSVETYDPKPAESGKIVTVWFKVENPSVEASDNTYLEIIPRDGLELSTGQPARTRIGLLRGYGTQSLEYRLRVRSEATEGQNLIQAKVISDTEESQTNLYINVEERELLEVDLAIGTLDSDPLRIKPGDENVKLDVTLLNIGDGTAQNVRAELAGLPSGITLPESYGGLSLLGNIGADSTSSATFYIDVDETVKPGEYLAQLKLDYKYKPDQEEETYLTEQRTIPMKISIRPVPLYEIVSAVFTPESLTAGDRDVKVLITVKNIGEEKGESVRLKVYGKSDQPFKFDESSDFIAPILESGETGQATLAFDINDDAHVQTYYLDLEIKNVVGEDVLTYSKKIPVVVANARPERPLTWAIIGFALIAIVLIIWGVRKTIARTQTREPKKPKKSYFQE